MFNTYTEYREWEDGLGKEPDKATEETGWKREIHKESIEGLLSCRSTDKTRDFIQHAYMEDGKRLLATDGKKLGIYELEEPLEYLYTGYVQLVKNGATYMILPADKNTNEMQFPGWRRVLPRLEPDMQYFDVTLPKKITINNDGIRQLQVILYRLYRDYGTPIDLRFIKDMCHGQTARIFPCSAPGGKVIMVQDTNSYIQIVVEMWLPEKEGTDSE